MWLLQVRLLLPLLLCAVGAAAAAAIAASCGVAVTAGVQLQLLAGLLLLVAPRQRPWRTGAGSVPQLLLQGSLVFVAQLLLLLANFCKPVIIEPCVATAGFRCVMCSMLCSLLLTTAAVAVMWVAVSKN
jgi:hypothetical protein